MPTVLSGVLRIAEESFTHRGTPVTLRTYQPVVWVSLASWREPDVSLGEPFPVVLDTGNNHELTFPRDRFAAWVDVGTRPLVATARLRVNDALWAECYRFDVRLHDGPGGRVVRVLTTDRGVSVLPPGIGGPRLPNLGVRCLCLNQLRLRVDGDTQRFTLSTSPTPRRRLTPPAG